MIMQILLNAANAVTEPSTLFTIIMPNAGWLAALMFVLKLSAKVGSTQAQWEELNENMGKEITAINEKMEKTEVETKCRQRECDAKYARVITIDRLQHDVEVVTSLELKTTLHNMNTQMTRIENTTNDMAKKVNKMEQDIAVIKHNEKIGE